MKRMWVLLLLIVAMGSANAQDRPNVVVMLADNIGYGDIVGTSAWVIGEYRKSLEKYPNPKAVDLTQFGR